MILFETGWDIPSVKIGLITEPFIVIITCTDAEFVCLLDKSCV